MTYDGLRTDRGAGVARPRGRPSRARRGLALGLFLLAAAGTAVFAAVSTSGTASEWFQRAAHVVWSLPTAWSAPIWAVVFLLLGLAGWQMWERATGPARRVALTLYALDLVLIAVWPPIFLDGYDVIGVAALWIAFAAVLLLDLLVAATMTACFLTAKPAAFLLLPVLLWLLYSSSVNWGNAALALITS